MNHRSLLRIGKRTRHAGALSVTTAAALAFLSLVSAPAHAAVTLPGHVPWGAVLQSRAIEPVASEKPVQLAFTLPLRRPEELNLLLHRLYDPADPLCGHFLTPGQFAARFAPTDQDYQAVSNFVQSQGLTVTGRHPNHLLLDVSGPASRVENALHLNLLRFQHADGRFFRSPDRDPVIPDTLAGRVAAVVGLDTAAVWHTHSRALSPMAAPFGFGTGPGGGLSPQDVKNVYNLNGVTPTGSGQTIALFEADGYRTSDITAFETRFGLPNIPLENVAIDGYNGAIGVGSGEVTMDIEMIAGLAPGASKILVYECPNTGASVLDTYNRMANDGRASVISTSWGANEASVGSAELQSERQIFQQMAAQGQTVFAAAGDTGAFDDGQTLSVDDPASQPEVIGVGGTHLHGSVAGYFGESVWNNSISSGGAGGAGGAGGGGISHFWPIPSWQQPVVSQVSGASSSMRNVPDVALDADPNTGYSVYYSGSWAVYGGTSCGAPIWAAFTALVNQQRQSEGRPVIGAASATLYGLAGTSSYARDFHDVADGTTNGYYPATIGYDLATGLGSFNGSNLLADLAPPATTLHTFPGSGWHLVSSPYVIAQTFARIPLKAYAFHPVTKSYIAAPSTPADTFHIGQGYWIYVNGSGVNIPGPGTPTDNSQPFTVTLSQGWNMVGNPFTGPEPLSTLQLQDASGSVTDFATAVSLHAVSPLYVFSSSNQQYLQLKSGGDSLNAWDGAWIYAQRPGATLIFNAPSH